MNSIQIRLCVICFSLLVLANVLLADAQAVEVDATVSHPVPPALSRLQPQPEEYLMLHTTLETQSSPLLIRQLQFETLLRYLLNGKAFAPAGLVGPNGRSLLPSLHAIQP